MSGDVVACHNWWEWVSVVPRGQRAGMLLNILQCTSQFATMIGPTQNINRAEVGTPKLESSRVTFEFSPADSTACCLCISHDLASPHLVPKHGIPSQLSNFSQAVP